MKKTLMLEIKSLQVIFEQKTLLSLLSSAQVSSSDNERGGVILGRLFPESSKIVITHVIESKKAKSRRYRFDMNVDEVQNTIDDIWENSKGHITYLGDWHTHPEKRPKPSIKDHLTFRKNYFGTRVDQNLLLYIIVGTNSKEENSLWMAACNGLRLFSLNNTDSLEWQFR